MSWYRKSSTTHTSKPKLKDSVHTSESVSNHAEVLKLADLILTYRGGRNLSLLFISTFWVLITELPEENGKETFFEQKLLLLRAGLSLSFSGMLFSYVFLKKQAFSMFNLYTFTGC